MEGSKISKYDAKKTIPEIKEIVIRNGGGRLSYEARWELYKNMNEVDKDINFYALRPLTGELLNFIDGKRTIQDIADAVGYEYGVKIRGEDFLTFLIPQEEAGIIKFKT